MATYIQVSSFISDVGFYETAATVLREAIHQKNSIVFICSRPDEFQANDERVQKMLGWFQAIGIEFDHFRLLDHRADADANYEDLLQASCIFMMSGDTALQMDFIKRYRLESILETYQSVIVGVSAGAINLARLGLVPTHVVPHFDKRPPEYIETHIMPLTFERLLYGLCETGVVLHTNESIQWIGENFELKDGKSIGMRPFVAYKFLKNQLTAQDVVAFQEKMNLTVDPVVQWEKSLKHTLFTITVMDEQKVIGMGRLLGDGAIYWYINDVYVLNDYQGKGVGKAIVCRLIEHIKSNSIPNTDVSVCLMSAQGKEGFYEKLGFRCRPHEYEGSGMELELSIGSCIIQ